jgi:hypothetical protein
VPFVDQYTGVCAIDAVRFPLKHLKKRCSEEEESSGDLKFRVCGANCLEEFRNIMFAEIGRNLARVDQLDEQRQRLPSSFIACTLPSSHLIFRDAVDIFVASCNLGEISSLEFARDLREPERQGCTPTVCAVQKVEFRREWLKEGLDRRNVVTVAESKKDSPESGLIELATLRDDHVAQGKVQRRWIGASVARSQRRAAHKPTFSEQLVRDCIES